MKFGMSSAVESLPAVSSNKRSGSTNKAENIGKFGEENREDFSSEDECDTSSIDSTSSSDDNSGSTMYLYDIVAYPFCFRLFGIDRSKCLPKRRTGYKQSIFYSLKYLCKDDY